MISENALRCLMKRLCIFPAFLDVLCAFGKSVGPTSDSLGGCFSWQTDSRLGLYLLKLQNQE